MNAKLLQKIEELTLYTLAQQKEIDLLKKGLIDQNDLLERLEKSEQSIHRQN